MGNLLTRDWQWNLTLAGPVMPMLRFMRRLNLCCTPHSSAAAWLLLDKRIRTKMYRKIQGSTNGFSDTERFIDLLDHLPESVSPDGKSFFSSASDLIVTRAPGRLDLMGGIADYSGSLVLQLPIASGAHVALQIS